MGFITLEKANHLFWLGRYTERVSTTINYFQEYYDIMIDKDEFAYKDFCSRLDISNIYEDSDDFCSRYVFDKSNFDSLVTNLCRAYDNAVVLRDVISGETLCYIEMALKLFDSIHDESPVLELQRIIDYLYAFWGSVDDFVESEACRNIMKAGKYAERLDLLYRFDKDIEDINKQKAKLKNRIKKLKTQYKLEGVTNIDKAAGKLDCLEQIIALTKLFEVVE